MDFRDMVSRYDVVLWTTPKFTKRHRIIAILFVALLGTCLTTLALLPGRGGVKKKFDQVERGMRRSSVESLMGRPPDSVEHIRDRLRPPQILCQWKVMEHVSALVCFEDGAVVGKQWADPHHLYPGETFPQTVLRWILDK
jgi:hypothetical protein